MFLIILEDGCSFHETLYVSTKYNQADPFFSNSLLVVIRFAFDIGPTKAITKNDQGESNKKDAVHVISHTETNLSERICARKIN